MNRRSNSLFILLTFAAISVSFNYYTSINITIENSIEEPISPSQLGTGKNQRNHVTQRNSAVPFHHSNITLSADLNRSRNESSEADLATLFNLSIPIHKSNKDDPFASQTRTGQMWKSPHKHKNNGRHWWKYSDTCFAVDNICRISNNRWFYFHQISGLHEKEPWQPTFELKYMPYSYNPKTWADTRVQVNVRSTDFVTLRELLKVNQCEVSSVPYHIVLQSNFNDMIGEFYLRTLIDLHKLLIEAMVNGTSDQSPIEDTQYYVHIAFENKKLLDAHKLMLSGMHRPLTTERDDAKIDSIRWAKSAINLVEDGDACQCYSKLVFCGYNITYKHNALVKESKYSLWPDSNLDTASKDTNRRLSPCEPTSRAFAQYPFECQEYAKLKSYLLSNIESHYSDIEGAVANFRRRLLTEQKQISQSYTGDTKEWTIVGLAQRSSRRVWLNLPDVISACGKLLEHAKVACIEINVENTSSPHEQFLLHRSLDAIVGVHGAQMTQALFLRPMAHVLELLPWIPDFTRGKWTARRATPTPIGIMFHNTDLNHYGFSLNRSSVPLCTNTSQSPELDKQCLTSDENGKKFVWADRDFLVDVNVVVWFVENFIMQAEMLECKDLKAEAGKEWVLYNVWCKDSFNLENGANASFSADLHLRHFYRKEMKA